MPLALIVLPADPEGEHPLRFHHPIEQVGFFVLGMLFDDGFQRGENLLHSLDELGLIRVLLFHVLDYAGKIRIHQCASSFIYMMLPYGLSDLYGHCNMS